MAWSLAVLYGVAMRRLASVALLLVALAAPLAVGLGIGEASAGVAYESPYTFEQTFGTALRLVRVDLNLKITEKDVENGYLLFDYRSPESGGKSTQGSIEIVNGRSSVHVVVQIPAMPRYHEQVILDALVQKLSAEHGAPPTRPAPSPPAETDAGPDAAP